MTADLAAFLLARYDEAEQLARSVEESVGADRAGEPYCDGSGIADRDDYPSYPWGLDEAELAFMARWHPRVVLADVTAKRRIVEEIAPMVEGYDDQITSEWGGSNDGTADKLLGLLGLEHADHPDYRPEWAP